MNTLRIPAIIGSLVALLALNLSCSSSAQVVPTPALNQVIVGKLLLPPGSGSRGMHVILDIDIDDSLHREWLELDDVFSFRSSFTGTLKKLEVATGLASVVHQLNAQELAQLTKQDTVDIGIIDLREQLLSHKIKVLSEAATTLRIGMWLEQPMTDFSGNLPSLGSRQFPEIAAGKEADWLIPSEFDTVYFLVEEPADRRRGREWQSGRQKLFGPYRSTNLPAELSMD